MDIPPGRHPVRDNSSITRFWCLAVGNLLMLSIACREFCGGPAWSISHRICLGRPKRQGHPQRCMHAWCEEQDGIRFNRISTSLFPTTSAFLALAAPPRILSRAILFLAKSHLGTAKIFSSSSKFHCYHAAIFFPSFRSISPHRLASEESSCVAESGHGTHVRPDGVESVDTLIDMWTRNHVGDIGLLRCSG